MAWDKERPPGVKDELWGEETTFLWLFQTLELCFVLRPWRERDRGMSPLIGCPLSELVLLIALMMGQKKLWLSQATCGIAWWKNLFSHSCFSVVVFCWFFFFTYQLTSRCCIAVKKPMHMLVFHSCQREFWAGLEQSSCLCVHPVPPPHVLLPFCCLILQSRALACCCEEQLTKTTYRRERLPAKFV